MCAVSFRGPRRLSDAEIVRLYVEERLDSDSIGARANCTATCVLDLVRAAGHQVRRKGGRRKSLRIPDEEIVRRYREGESGVALADAIGCTPSSIYHVLRRAGVQRRKDAVALNRDREVARKFNRKPSQ